METPYLSIISTKGQLTIPKDMREMFDLHAGQTVLMQPSPHGLILKKVNLQTAEKDFTEEEWDVLLDMASERGKSYPSGKKFLTSLK